MKYVLSAIGLNLAVVFGGAQHGIIGAILLGVSIVLVDCLLFWIRYFQWCQNYRLGKKVSVVSGFVIRLLSVLLWLKVGQSWLTPRAFWICAAMVLSLPVWNFASVLLWKRKGL